MNGFLLGESLCANEKRKTQTMTEPIGERAVQDNISGTQKAAASSKNVPPASS